MTAKAVLVPVHWAAFVVLPVVILLLMAVVLRPVEKQL